MIDLTAQEAMSIWLLQSELGVDERADALQNLARRNGLTEENLLTITEAYVAGLNKLLAYAESSVEARPMLRLIQGGKKD